uniref:CDGP domain-containing protein n=1 Tax=Mycobacterium phage Pharb TaxID=3136626 RepID=A0AAU8GRR5_9VIRU
MKSLRVGLAAAAVAVAAVTSAPIASADYDPGCKVDLWGFLGSSRRLICDGPLQPDGSWMRSREFYVPAHHVPLRTTCSGSYSVTCTTTGGYFQERQSDGIEVYPVTPATLLGDEPPHLDEGVS